MPKDKVGNQLTWKEFFKRWGEGIEGITPIQKVKTQLLGTRISLLGLFIGICVSLYVMETLWWVGIILLGAIINTGVQYLGLKQQLNMFNNMEQYEEVDLDNAFNEEDKSGTELEEDKREVN